MRKLIVISLLISGSILAIDNEFKATPQLIEQANQGDDYSQYMLGNCYFYGRGVNKDLEKAFKLYGQASDQGVADAQYMRGYCYEHGLGTGVDLSGAVFWYKCASDNGSSEARYHLGLCYEKGIGVTKDEMEAYAYYNLAARFQEEAKAKRDSMEKEMTVSMRIQGQQRSKQIQKESEEKIAKGLTYGKKQSK
jgi:TPR repeat protein